MGSGGTNQPTVKKNEAPRRSEAQQLENQIAGQASPGNQGVLATNLCFGDAFEKVKCGMAMRLPSWNSDVFIKVQYPDENSKMTHPYLYVQSNYGRVPWKETVVELFSESWVVVDI